MEDQNETKHDQRRVNVLYIIFFLLTGLFGFMLYRYSKTFADLGNTTLTEESRKLLLDKAATWGQLGDYFGGLANPVIGWITIFLLILNFVYQNKQLKHAQDESKATQTSAAKQSFEQSFFSLMSNYRELLDCITLDIQIDSNKLAEYGEEEKFLKELRGRSALQHLWNKHMTWIVIHKEVFADIQDIPFDGEETEENVHPSIQTSSFKPDEIEVLRHMIRHQFNRMNRDDLNNILPLLKSILLILEWLDSHEERLPEETRRFTLILISSLSSIELLMIFFHTLLSNDTSQKTKDIFSKYSIFSAIRYIEPRNIDINAFKFSRQHGVGEEKRTFPDSAFSKVEENINNTR